MAPGSPLSLIFVLLFLLVAGFYLFRLVHPAIWIAHLDAESEGGHAMMAIGMIFMLVPGDWLTPFIIRWNIVLFAASALWWMVRLFTRRPLLAMFWRLRGASSTVRADAIHALMHAGMCYLFLLMSSMAFSMTAPGVAVTCLLLVAFALLTLFYGREVAKDFQATQLSWLQLGANLAHLLMSGMMCWMCLTTIFMIIRMKG
jgi:hypothetical protein